MKKKQRSFKEIAEELHQFLARDAAYAPIPVPITSPAEAYAAIICQYPSLRTGGKRERMVALYLDGRSRLIKMKTISIGTATATLVHPREVLAPALKSKIPVASMVLAHNHPSGDPSPSREDRLLTERLNNACQLMGINLDDHLILGRGTHTSFKQLGLLIS